MRPSSPPSRTRASATTRRCSSRSSRRRMREDDIPKKGRAPSHSWKKASPRTIIHPHAFSYALIWICPWIHGYPHGHVHRHPHGYVHGHPHGDAHQIEGKQARRFMYMNRARSLPRPAALEQQPECRRPDIDFLPTAEAGGFLSRMRHVPHWRGLPVRVAGVGVSSHGDRQALPHQPQRVRAPAARRSRLTAAARRRNTRVPSFVAHGCSHR